MRPVVYVIADTEYLRICTNTWTTIRCHRCVGYCTSPKILNRVSGSLSAGTENDSVPARCLRTACALRPNPHVQGQRSQVSSQRGVAALRLRRQAQSRKAMTGSRKVQQVHGRQTHPNDDVLDDIGFLTIQTIPQFACPEAHKNSWMLSPVQVPACIPALQPP